MRDDAPWVPPSLADALVAGARVRIRFSAENRCTDLAKYDGRIAIIDTVFRPGESDFYCLIRLPDKPWWGCLPVYAAELEPLDADAGEG